MVVHVCVCVCACVCARARACFCTKERAELVPGQNRPDMTFAVGWALKNNYLSILGKSYTERVQQCSKVNHQQDERNHTKVGKNLSYLKLHVKVDLGFRKLSI